MPFMIADTPNDVSIRLSTWQNGSKVNMLFGGKEPLPLNSRGSRWLAGR